MFKICDEIKKGNIESVKTLLKNDNITKSTFDMWKAVCDINTRNYKLYRQIVVCKLLLLYTETDYNSAVQAVNYAIKKNCTYIVKQFLRRGVTPTALPANIKENMTKLLISFNIMEDVD